MVKLERRLCRDALVHHAICIREVTIIFTSLWGGGKAEIPIKVGKLRALVKTVNPHEIDTILSIWETEAAGGILSILAKRVLVHGNIQVVSEAIQESDIL